MTRCTCIYGNGQWCGDKSEKLTTDADVGSVFFVETFPVELLSKELQAEATPFLKRRR